MVVLKNHRGAIKDCSMARVGAKNCSSTAKLCVIIKNLILMTKCRLHNVTHHLCNKEDIIINVFQENGIGFLVLRRVVVNKMNHCATFKDCNVTAWVVALIDLTSKAVLLIKNHRAMAVMVTKKNHCGRIKDPTWVVALINSTSKVIMIENCRAMARAIAARLVVVIKTLFKFFLKFQLYLVVQHLTIKLITHNICSVVMHLMMVLLILQAAVITTIIGTILVMSPMLIATTLVWTQWIIFTLS